jgi:isocitrate dehydrogenase
VGVDVYVEWPSADPNSLAAVAGKASGEGLKLQMISNRGVKVWPDGMPETFCTDSFRCRFIGDGTNHQNVLGLLGRVLEQKLEIVKTEYLRTTKAWRASRWLRASNHSCLKISRWSA